LVRHKDSNSTEERKSTQALLRHHKTNLKIGHPQDSTQEGKNSLRNGRSKFPTLYARLL